MSAGAFADRPQQKPYQSKNFAPEHQKSLQQAILACADQVNQARDPETRSKHQADLCKKLIQAEDYDRAIQVAAAIHRTEGIEAERRAVHHFLVAQIWALKMNASPNLELMQANRMQAIAAAREVVARQYASQWMIHDEAQQLLKDLQNPATVQAAEAWVRKRQQGGVDDEKMRAAQMQSASIEADEGGGSSYRGWNFGRNAPAQRPQTLVPMANYSERPEVAPDRITATPGYNVNPSAQTQSVPSLGLQRAPVTTTGYEPIEARMQAVSARPESAVFGAGAPAATAPLASVETGRASGVYAPGLEPAEPMRQPAGSTANRSRLRSALMIDGATVREMPREEPEVPASALSLLGTESADPTDLSDVKDEYKRLSEDFQSGKAAQNARQQSPSAARPSAAASRQAQTRNTAPAAQPVAEAMPDASMAAPAQEGGFRRQGLSKWFRGRQGAPDVPGTGM